MFLPYRLNDRVVGQEEMIKELENKLRRSLMTRGSNSEDSATFTKMQVGILGSERFTVLLALYFKK